MNEFEKLFRPLTQKEYEERIVGYIKEICYQNPDGTWSADGDVNLFGMKLTKLPVQFKEVKGYFNCAYNNLITLEGAPRKVKGYFYCNNNNLTSLEDSPEEVGGKFYCYNNKLTSLEGAPEVVRGNFDCSYNILTSLEGAPKVVGGDFYADYNLKSVKELKKTIDRPYMERII